MPFIRYAVPLDAKNLAALAEATFRATFGSMNTAENMDLHCQESYGADIQLAELNDADVVTLVCEDDGKLIAYAQLRWSERPGCVPASNPGEIQRIYVAQAWQGKGIAQQLMERCLHEMANKASDMVWLGVWEHNPRAIAFYSKIGFTEVGSHVFPVGTDPQRDIIMLRPITGG